MNARPKLVVGNWKLHGSLNTNAALLEQIKAAGKTNATLAVCAPFPYLAQCQSLLAGSAVGWGEPAATSAATKKTCIKAPPSNEQCHGIAIGA